ncbi:hypothetical protein [Antarcticirhabdus aurantiaca]|uniref:Uncharacterized protein n=1 Tax=Antarcticirhabdus aurantiaca TaxID=2606717 RepID=A0ACD4NL26_9HYPH|nr:hypothetical protein [Antarcticirhabdus aurantiaca]WAJ27494.1 hypothetical protein OXU80_22025 [Jeongeuplla avenae]
MAAALVDPPAVDPGDADGEVVPGAAMAAPPAEPERAVSSDRPGLVAAPAAATAAAAPAPVPVAAGAPVAAPDGLPARSSPAFVAGPEALVAGEGAALAVDDAGADADAGLAPDALPAAEGAAGFAVADGEPATGVAGLDDGLSPSSAAKAACGLALAPEAGGEAGAAPGLAGAAGLAADADADAVAVVDGGAEACGAAGALPDFASPIVAELYFTALADRSSAGLAGPAVPRPAPSAPPDFCSGVFATGSFFSATRSIVAGVRLGRERRSRSFIPESSRCSSEAALGWVGSTRRRANRRTFARRRRAAGPQN